MRRLNIIIVQKMQIVFEKHSPDSRVSRFTERSPGVGKWQASINEHTSTRENKTAIYMYIKWAFLTIYMYLKCCDPGNNTAEDTG